MAKKTHTPAAADATKAWPWPLLLWSAALAVYMAVSFAVPVNLFTADLGRHIANGELLMQGQWEVLTTNYFSFTEPKHPFTNHHWGSGVIFYLLLGAGGYEALSLLYILLYVASVLMVAWACYPSGTVRTALLAAMFCVMLMAYRTEVRPEGFSYLLIAVYYLMFSRFKENAMSFRRLAMLALPLQLLWVNLHIFFFFGFMVGGAFLLDAWLMARDRPRALSILRLLLAMAAVSLLNPHHIRGLLAPLTIFNEYGYMVLENQTVLFLQGRFGTPVFIHFELLAGLLAVAAGAAIWKGLWRGLLPELLLSSVALVLAFSAVRGIPMAVLFGIPLLAKALGPLAGRWRPPGSELLRPLLPFAATFLCLFLTVHKDTYASAIRGYQKLGTYDRIDSAIKFFKRSGMRGPIFNNYDIGSYLIHFLHRQEKVFVDNRPEAYSVAFFESLYKPMQQDEAFFQHVSDSLDLNVIWFYRLDNTEHAQPFLIRRTQDPEWVPVYVDDMCLILLRNHERNAAILRQYALPREMFISVPN